MSKEKIIKYLKHSPSHHWLSHKAMIFALSFNTGPTLVLGNHVGPKLVY